MTKRKPSRKIEEKPQTVISPKKKLPPLTFWQKIGLIGFSILLILLLEGILRWRGYGGHFPLFIPRIKQADGSMIYSTHPQAQILFFMNRSAKADTRIFGTMRQEKIIVPKPKN